MKPGWKIWIDRGGTFTDVIAQRPDGSLATLKILSADPERYADPVHEAISRLLQAEDGQVDFGTIEVVRIGTTVATNALLEGQGEPTVLVTTRGFGDALWIGYQARPMIFDLNIRRPAPLYADVVEAEERLAADGSVSIPLAEAKLEDDLRAAVRAVPSVRALARRAGVRQPSLVTFLKGSSLDLHTASLLASALGMRLTKPRKRSAKQAQR